MVILIWSLSCFCHHMVAGADIIRRFMLDIQDSFFTRDLHLNWVAWAGIFLCMQALFESWMGFLTAWWSQGKFQMATSFPQDKSSKRPRQKLQGLLCSILRSHKALPLLQSICCMEPVQIQCGERLHKGMNTGRGKSLGGHLWRLAPTRAFYNILHGGW